MGRRVCAKEKAKGREAPRVPLEEFHGLETLRIFKVEARRKAEELEAFLQDLLARKGISRSELEEAWEEVGR